MKQQLLSAATVAAMALLGPGAATAQTAGYPDGAEPLTQDALHQALADKVFSVTPARGSTWQWTFKSDGQFYLSAGNYSNSGKWSARDSRLCQESVKTTGCNDVRQKDGLLHVQRDSGEVVVLRPK